MNKRWLHLVLVMTLLAGLWVLRPITEAVGARMKARVVNTVKVKESGALVRKVFDRQIGPGTRHGAGITLKGYKTLRVAVYQTTETGSSSGPAVQTNFSCTSTVQNRLGVDVTFGGGGEGGVTAGNNILQVDEPPSMTNRPSLYAAEFQILRPQVGFDICNSSTEPINVEIFVHAFRN